MVIHYLLLLILVGGGWGVGAGVGGEGSFISDYWWDCLVKPVGFVCLGLIGYRANGRGLSKFSFQLHFLSSNFCGLPRRWL